MSEGHTVRFLDLPPCPIEKAEVVILSLPFEKTVSYGRGAATGPQAILDASRQIELFDEETEIDFDRGPRIHTAEAVEPGERSVEGYLADVARRTSALRDRFVLSLGGEHTVTYGAARGLVPSLRDLTIVQIDAHADLIDALEGNRWSHGTVMRRLWDEGCRIVSIGVRSLSREEFDLARKGDRIRVFFAHRLEEEWRDAIQLLLALEGPVYLSLDVDGLDPAVLPSTGTPQPGGLSWKQATAILEATARAPKARFIGADIVEYVASPNPPGSDLTAAKLATRLLAYRESARRTGRPSPDAGA
ncbi:MAG: agmatinase [Candidatus Eisenbacteria bacterium]|nr:agmatinase [Candidatus Eisenbacteria bacterium]